MNSQLRISTDFSIPSRLNIGIPSIQAAVLITLLLLAGRAENWFVLSILSVLYGIAMNSGYALLHEAEHNLFHPNPKINQLGGVLLALFFPAPFHLLRQGHLGHHMRNRSDDEAFDFYFEGENPLWKNLQFYGILTGLFWCTIVLSNILALVKPTLVEPKYAGFDRPTAAFLASFNPAYRRLIRIEAALVFLLHGSFIVFAEIPLTHYMFVLFGFGFSWSAMQYVHHFGTVRDVLKGARNLKTAYWLDKLWLNHNWHLNHHLNPTVSWIYLPKLLKGAEFQPGNLFVAYLRMWHGPRFTHERVDNLYAGAVVK